MKTRSVQSDLFQKVSDRILQRENVLGVRAVSELVHCAISGEPSQLLAREISDYDDYYSSSLFLLAVRVAAERLPHCRSDSVLAATPAACADDAATGLNCPLANPIPGRIQRSPLTIRLADIAQLPNAMKALPTIRFRWSSVTVPARRSHTR